MKHSTKQERIAMSKFVLQYESYEDDRSESYPHSELFSNEDDALSRYYNIRWHERNLHAARIVRHEPSIDGQVIATVTMSFGTTRHSTRFFVS